LRIPAHKERHSGGRLTRPVRIGLALERQAANLPALSGHRRPWRWWEANAPRPKKFARDTSTRRRQRCCYRCHLLAAAVVIPAPLLHHHTLYQSRTIKMSSIVDPRRRLPPMNNRFLDSSSDEEEDEETRLQREEEEQERLLSEQHGEAEESSSQKRKPEEDIEAEYSRKKARRRPTLTPAMVTSSKGLIRIRSEFPRQVKWPTTTKNKVNAAATYSRTLVNSYKSFCYDLFPNSAFQDVLTRLESFGAKKEIKDYLQQMREEVRNAHLEKIYGKEKAQAMITELEHGLKQQHDEFRGGDAFMMEDAPRDYELRREPARGPSVEESGGSGSGEAAAVTVAGTTSGNAAENTTVETRAPETSSNTTSATTTTITANQTKTTVQQDDLEDSDDELEFVVSSKPTPVNPFADDDEDDDDEEEAEFGAVSSTSVATKNAAEEEKQQEGSPPGMAVDDKEEEEGAAVKETSIQADKESAKRTDKADETVGLEDASDGSPEKPTSQDQDSQKTTSGAATMDTQVESIVPQESQDSEDIVDESQGDEEKTAAPSQEQEEVPSSSDETATIIPTMTESQFDDVATQQEGEDWQGVAAETLQETYSKSTQDQEALSSPEETATQMESTLEEEDDAGSSQGADNTDEM